MVYIGDMITHGSANLFFFRGTIPQVGHSGSLERIAVYRTDGDAGAGWLPGRANQVDSTRKNGGFNGI